MGKNECKDVQGAQTEQTATEATEMEQTPTEMEQTPTEATEAKQEVSKAAKILRARLPLLSEHGLNFERRTGNFFRATLVDVVDKEGSDVIDPATNKPMQKVSRLVVDPHNSAAEGVAFEACADEIAIKRSARIVADKDDKIASFNKREQVIQTAKGELDAERATFEAELELATVLVDAYELPERAKSERVAVTAKLTQAVSDNERLRALLAAAGIDPDAQ